MQISKIKTLASKYKWVEILPRKNPAMISFARENERINVFHTTGTVATIINHPTGKRTQLFRRNIDFKELATIFDRPRTHTGKGYFKAIKPPCEVSGPSTELLDKLEKELLEQMHDLNAKVVNIMIMRTLTFVVFCLIFGLMIYKFIQ